MGLSNQVILAAKSKCERAERVYADLAGQMPNDGLGLQYFGDYVLVDDGQGRWLTDTESYQSALDTVLTKVLERTANIDPSEYYSYLCNDCGSMYSCIGVGDYNDRPVELRACLLEDLSEYQVSEIFRYLGILDT